MCCGCCGCCGIFTCCCIGCIGSGAVWRRRCTRGSCIGTTLPCSSRTAGILTSPGPRKYLGAQLQPAPVDVSTSDVPVADSWVALTFSNPDHHDFWIHAGTPLVLVMRTVCKRPSGFVNTDHDSFEVLAFCRAVATNARLAAQLLG